MSTSTFFFALLALVALSLNIALAVIGHIQVHLPALEQVGAVDLGAIVGIAQLTLVSFTTITLAYTLHSSARSAQTADLPPIWAAIHDGLWLCALLSAVLLSSPISVTLGAVLASLVLLNGWDILQSTLLRNIFWHLQKICLNICRELYYGAFQILGGVYGILGGVYGILGGVCDLFGILYDVMGRIYGIIGANYRIWQPIPSPATAADNPPDYTPPANNNRKILPLTLLHTSAC